MKTAAHALTNILAIGVLSVAAGSAQSSGGERHGDTSIPARHFLTQRADRGEDRFLPTTSTTSATDVQSATTTKPVPVGRPASSTTSTSASVAAVGVNELTAKMFIYMKESGNNPAAHNSHGCRGLGQACPGSKLPCSDSDYACQDDWFTAYCMGRYGSWENAKAFWLSNGWW